MQGEHRPRAVCNARGALLTNALLFDSEYGFRQVRSYSKIVRFTDIEQQSALRAARASLTEAVARQRQAIEEFRRSASLYESGSGSKREYDSALAARDA